MPRFIGSQSLTNTRFDAANSATAAATSETNAAASATAAANSATAAAASESSASSASITANNHKNDAQTASTSASNTLTEFRGDYLGDHASDTAADSHASSNSYSVTVGTMYFNSTNSQMRICTATGSPNNTYEAVNTAAVSAGRYLQTGDGNNVIDAGATASAGAKTTTDLTVGTPGGTAKAFRVTGDTQLDGNLTVSGTTTTVNTATLDVADNQITLNSDVTGTPTENAGISVNRGSSADKTLLWDEGTDKWTVGSETFVAGAFEGNLTGNVTGQVSTISNFSTDDLSEGSTNKYFSGKTTTDLAEGTNLYYTDARVDTRLGTKTTDDITEGSSNLYHNNTRWDNRLATKTTDNLAEGSTNQYYTDERVDDRVNALITDGEGITTTYDDNANTLTIAAEDADTTNKGIASFSSDHFSVSSGAVTLKADGIDDTHIDFGTGTNQVNTDVLTEGSTNQYHTTARARGSISATGGGISYNNSTGVITSTAVDQALALSIALG